MEPDPQVYREQVKALYLEARDNWVKVRGMTDDQIRAMWAKEEMEQRAVMDAYAVPPGTQRDDW